MFLCVLYNLFEDLCGSAGWFPTPHICGKTRIEQVDASILVPGSYPTVAR